MPNIPNLIKWTGTKRKLANTIIGYFPKQIETYYEPFLGSGAVLRLMLEQGRAQNYIASDLCEPLINLWKSVRDCPDFVSSQYRQFHSELQADPKNYYRIRDEFNSGNSNLGAFLFLLRTCANGIARFNRHGKFNSSLHLGRPGINPNDMHKIIFDWASKIQKVEFLCRDYREINPRKNDFCYFDPPYSSSNSLYLGNFDGNAFFEFIKKLECPCAYTYNEKRGERLFKKPLEQFYDRHIGLPAFLSSFSHIFAKKSVEVSEQLYLLGAF